MLFVIQIITFVLIAWLRSLGALPSAFSMLESLAEFSDIERAVFPGVLAFAIGLSFLVFASVGVTVLENICTLTMLETLLPLSFIAITVFPGVHSVAFSF